MTGLGVGPGGSTRVLYSYRLPNGRHSRSANVKVKGRSASLFGKMRSCQLQTENIGHSHFCKTSCPEKG